MLTGVFYTAIAKYSGVVISLAVTAVLSRLIPIEEFGIVAIATVLIAFFSMFSDMGIAPAIIQKKDLTDDDLNNIFSFSIWSGLLLTALFFFGAWPIAKYYDSPVLVSICRLLSINLFFASANLVPNALLLRNKRFKFIGLRTFIIQIVCGIAAIASAYMGAGLYSIIVTPILTSIILFFINYSQYRLKFRFTLGLVSIRKIFSYSMYQLGFNLFNYFSRNLDNLLMGKHMSMTDLGYYEKSYKMMMYPLQLIPNIVSPVMHPIFSELQDDYKKLSASFMGVIKILAFIGFPLSALLFFGAKELILLLFGNQWGPSVPPFMILSLTVGLQIILSTTGAIFQASNSTKMLFWCGVATTVINIAAICIGVFGYGTTVAVAWSICISFTINFILTFYLMFYRVFHLSWTPLWLSLLSPLILTIITAGGLYGISLILPEELNMFLSLAIKSVYTVIAWVTYIQLTKAYDLRQLLSGIIHKKR